MPASLISTSCCGRSRRRIRPTSRSSAGPTEWCNDPAISTDLGYRWDGVHVYKPGAKLIYETIAPALLAIPNVSRPAIGLTIAGYPAV